MGDGNPYEAFLDAYTQEAAAEETTPAEARKPREGEWRDVWVWVGRARKEEVFPVSLELLGQAREIADQLGCRVGAVVLGSGIEGVEEALSPYGADVVYALDHPAFTEFRMDPVRDAFVALAKEYRPEIILVPATIQGRNLAAQLAARLHTGIVPNVEALELDTSDRTLRMTQRSFGGRLTQVYENRDARPQIATIVPGTYRRPAPDPTRRARRVDLTGIEPREARVKILEPLEPPTPPLRVRDAVLAGGLGLGSQEAWDRLEELGRLLDAAVVATPAAVACGWADEDQVLTSMETTIRPRLYVAFGVVGEYDHLKAIEDAERIISVTDDPEAPINEQADFVALGPPDEILTRVVERIQEAKQDLVTVGDGNSDA